MKKYITIKEKYYFNNNGAGFGPIIGDPVIILNPTQYKIKELVQAYESAGYKVEEDKPIK